MKLKRLLALLLAFGLVAAACGGSDDDEGEDTDTTEEGTEDGTGDEDADADGAAADDDEGAAADGELLTDYGVTDTQIFVGLNADLSGPFAALVSEIVEAQMVYWEWVNENGGIAGREVVPVVLDSGYATDKGIENYEELAQESEDGVLMISENTGSPITAAIYEDATADDMLLIPLSWASIWPDVPNVLGKQATYCVEAMNGVSWLADKVTADGGEPKLAILSKPGEYGADGAAGAAIAAEELGIEVVYDGTDQVAGDDRTAVISQLVDSGATMVWTTLTPAETLDIFGNAVSQGFEGIWSGNSPSFNYLVHLSSDFAAEFDQYYYQSGYNDVWSFDPQSDGGKDLVEQMTARRPDLNLSDVYITGWLEGIIVQTILEQAVANGDMTRAGMVEAASQVEIDYQGLAPNQSFFGDYNDIVVRESYIMDVRADEFDIKPMSSGEGSTGMFVEEGPFVADVTANYQFDGPCI
jgi:ABC-type branched-subunit amino acid transport system substrate-binding protein